MVRVGTNEDDVGRKAVTIRIARVSVVLSQTGKERRYEDKE